MFTEFHQTTPHLMIPMALIIIFHHFLPPSKRISGPLGSYYRRMKHDKLFCRWLSREKMVIKPHLQAKQGYNMALKC
jgi:hypothetical protein